MVGDLQWMTLPSHRRIHNMVTQNNVQGGGGAWELSIWGALNKIFIDLFHAFSIFFPSHFDWVRVVGRSESVCRKTFASLHEISASQVQCIARASVCTHSYF